ncbi:Holliday junction branch migration protein RuvA [Gordonia sp. (in: high G+C Gram-positive bacteria)]|jgi:Holliday junction DNA helicase RuvA|uniref:Holliday junction branch migration protein RuvA n=1 Tax=Gordonia sp. (in: high G+C Gram-positive bacteria) TaxID=84139 RepID=UPI001DAA68AD|nr:Holliday junction branch migration protein RuvA [Gordonia sp. (in: high G+C Gram-positive bacteria)]MCB1294494.1 Holliday junction branch migration protein RuvA [Gordonia sp. (in: high G+C Gram-positive bacteria)]HMS76333.1 Holliday junction branch migration protein RuvA [Gordonia sp. (in: high G+C Gram-positive bacteria)]HQV21017.1 Holliday junction branch migration protein RuvA [Gordonia sp. (in: high G+C Gram-positive bacteria)]
MIASVRGPVIDVALDHVVIDCAGVGYRVLVTPPTLATVRRGVETTLLTTMIVREDSMTLYGFVDPDARSLFGLLQTVTGVGPRLAMATLAVLEPDALRRALADSDTKALMSVPGIGKRVAERLVVELRDKVDLPVGAVGQGTDSAGGPLRGQVTEALVGLGFTVAAADKAVQSVLADNPGADASTALRAALSCLGKTS